MSSQLFSRIVHNDRVGARPKLKGSLITSKRNYQKQKVFNSSPLRQNLAQPLLAFVVDKFNKFYLAGGEVVTTASWFSSPSAEFPTFVQRWLEKKSAWVLELVMHRDTKRGFRSQMRGWGSTKVWLWSFEKPLKARRRDMITVHKKYFLSPVSVKPNAWQSSVESLSAQSTWFFLEHPCHEIWRWNKTATVIYLIILSNLVFLSFSLF